VSFRALHRIKANRLTLPLQVLSAKP